MKIINMEGFGQIPAGTSLLARMPAQVLETLKRYGVGLFTQCGNISDTLTALTVGTQEVDAVTYHGLQAQMYSTGGNTGFSLTFLLPDIRKAAVQFGFRLTLSAGKKLSEVPVMVGPQGFPTPVSDDEATSYYFEFFLRYQTNTTIRVEMYCNRVLMKTSTFQTEGGYYWCCPADQVKVTLGNSSIFDMHVNGVMTLGDIYLGTTDYGENYSAEPDLLGSVEVAACPVVSFEGAAHVNTQGKDVVAGLNSGAAEAGYLSLRPVDQPAVITFERADTVGRKVLGVMAGLTYRSSSAPNNHLAWQVRQGAVDGELMEEAEAKGDPGSWTTLTRTYMTPPDNTPAWDERNMQFSLVLYNRNNT